MEAERAITMFKRFFAWIREVLSRMLHINDAKQALGVDIAVGPEMRTAIDLWAQMFLDRPPWLDPTAKSLGLPAAIAGELARLTTVELESAVTGSPRADYLQETYREVLAGLRGNVETACAAGGAVFKPYLDNGSLVVECVPAWRFFPTAFHLGEVTAAVFVERVVKGKIIYTRMEHHDLTSKGYIIRNLAFRSHTDGALGVQCSLAEVDEWAELEPEITIRRKSGMALDHPLFAYFRIPMTNTVDPESPLGVSVYSRAVDLIKEADRQYSRILWEYEGSELAVDASAEALRVPRSDGKPAELPVRNQRLFRALAVQQGNGEDLYKVFSPAIRDTALFNGLDQMFRRIEFNCNLAYGTLSDLQSVDKTAEEIKTSKQRSYSAVCDTQKALQGALGRLVWALDCYTSLYKLAPPGKYEVSFTWGDGVLQDTDREYARRKEMADSGYLREELLLSWYFGVSEEEARKLMPEKEPPMFPPKEE